MLARPLVGIAAEEVAVSATVAVVSVQRQAEELAALVSAAAVHAQAELRLLHGVDAGLAAECLARLVTFAAAVPRAEATRPATPAVQPGPAAGTAPAFNYPVS